MKEFQRKNWGVQANDMRIIVTAGATREKIDDVRFISNVSTGALGCAIAEALLAVDSTSEVIYVCGEAAKTPTANARVRIVRVVDVTSLIESIKAVFEQEQIDGIVHAMAVSDYTVNTVTSTERLTQRITALSSKSIEFESVGKIGLTQWVSGLLHDDDAPTKQSKISSDWEDLIVVMRKTPKVISLLRALNPNAVLVGFKLLSGVS